MVFTNRWWFTWFFSYFSNYSPQLPFCKLTTTEIEKAAKIDTDDEQEYLESSGKQMLVPNRWHTPGCGCESAAKPHAAAAAARMSAASFSENLKFLSDSSKCYYHYGSCI